MSEKLRCNSCNIIITNQEGTTKFKCPECNNQEIIRCGHCRKLGAKYKCPECGFEGPN